MVEINGDPIWHGSITRIEETDCMLGGDEVNTPNRQLKLIMDMLEFLKNNQQSANSPPVIDSPIPNQTVLEMAPNQVIDLNTVFSDPEGQPLTFALESNSEPTKVNASLNTDQLTLSFPEWTDNFTLDSINAIIQVSATDDQALKTTNTFTITVQNLNTLFTEDYYPFDYVDADPGTSIYVNAAERTNIQNDFNLSQVFTEANAGNAVFKAISTSDSGLIPALALSNDVIVEVFRFRYVGADPGQGSYLYAVEPEATTIRGDADFVEEGSAFYAFDQTKTRDIAFKRYRFTGRRLNGDYVYALGASSPGDSSVFLEGTVVNVKLIQ